MTAELDDDARPWETLERLIEAGDRAAVRAWVAAEPLDELVRSFSRLPTEAQDRLAAMLTAQGTADLVAGIPDLQAVDLLGRLDPKRSAAILARLRSDAQADLLGDLDRADAASILSEMAPDVARSARSLTSYPDDVAGGLMIKEHLTFPEHVTVQDVLEDLRSHADRYRDYAVQYAYVTRDGRLRGVLRLRDLFFARADQPIEEVMRPDPKTISHHADLDELRAFFDRHPYFGVPVIDGDDRLVGIVTRAAVEHARADRSDSDFLKRQGIVGGEEFRTMPLLSRSRRRLAWLSVNVVLNILAASVIAFYQDTLTAVIALAVFLPIISDMSGCSGNQAVAVSMRELTLGLVRPGEVARVWLQEISVGAINGVALGALVALAAFLWKGSPALGLVVGVAMALNTVVAVSVGGTVPLLLRRFKMDPALASGPILTTVTDMSGFFLVLSIATAAMPLLTGG